MQGGGSSSPSPRVMQIPDSPTPSVQRPSSPSLSVQLPPPASFDKNYAPSQAPAVGRGRYDHLSCDHFHEQCYSRVASKAVSKIRLNSMAAGESRRTLTEDDAMDTSVSVTGKRNCTPVSTAEYLGGPPSKSGRATPCGWYSRGICRGDRSCEGTCPVAECRIKV